MRNQALRMVVAMLAIAAAAGRVDAALQVGGRGGWIESGGNLFDGSGSPGSHGLYGVALSVNLLPHAELEFAYERYADTFTFEEGRFENIVFSGRAEYETDAFLLGGKLVIPVGALGIVGGGGFSLQQIDLRVWPRNASIGSILDEMTGERNDWVWHALGGVRIHLTPLPFLLYAEFRYQEATEKPAANYSAVYGGINLYLD